jgi:hypothetical protein
MLQSQPHTHASSLDEAARFAGIRERIVLVLVLCVLIRTGQALADDQQFSVEGAVNSHTTQLRGNNTARQSSAAAAIPAPALTVDPVALADFTAPNLNDVKVYSATDFRPRRRTVFDKDPLANSVDDVPMLWNSTVWQQMADYKSRDRVRVLTLWESTGSSVSLQAGRHGDPSLQWTSRWMNRGGSTKGLLDQLFNVSLSGAGNKLRSLSRSSTSQEQPAKQIVTGPVTASQK